VEAGRPVSLHMGLPPRGVSTAWLAADTLAALLTGQTTVGTATAAGRLVSEPAGEVLRGVLENLVDSAAESRERGGDGRAREFDRPAGREIPAGEA